MGKQWRTTYGTSRNGNNDQNNTGSTKQAKLLVSLEVPIMRPPTQIYMNRNAKVSFRCICSTVSYSGNTTRYNVQFHSEPIQLTNHKLKYPIHSHSPLSQKVQSNKPPPPPSNLCGSHSPEAGKEQRTKISQTPMLCYVIFCRSKAAAQRHCHDSNQRETVCFSHENERLLSKFPESLDT